MPKRDSASSRPVYSTSLGRLCPQCQRAVAACVCGQQRPAYSGDGIVRIHKDSKGRGGKTVTVISGIPLDGEALKELTKQLKKRCGVGGSSHEECIEIQGDQRQLIKAELEKRGFTVKLAGG